MSSQKMQNESNGEKISVYQEVGGREELTPWRKCEGVVLYSDYGDNNMNLHTCLKLYTNKGNFTIIFFQLKM